MHSLPNVLDLIYSKRMWIQMKSYHREAGLRIDYMYVPVATVLVFRKALGRNILCI